MKTNTLILNADQGIHEDTGANTAKGFDLHRTLDKMEHFLPSQTPLKDFIHHNSLHAFQHLKFYDAIFKASEIFGYKVTLELQDFRVLHQQGRIREYILDRVITQQKNSAKAAEWKQKMLAGDYEEKIQPRIGQLRSCWKSGYKVDLDSVVQPLLFRILCSYLDQGISIQHFPLAEGGFLASMRLVEKNPYTSFFKTKRAKQLFRDENCTIHDLLKILAGDESFFEQYLFDQQFSHRGWSGMVAVIGRTPQVLLDQRKISLHDLIFFELLLEIDALHFYLGNNWKPLSTHSDVPFLDLFAQTPSTELKQILTDWQNAFEWSYYDEVLGGLSACKPPDPIAPEALTFQALFCIDERECSFRRHIENADPHCETFGTPGFFGVEFYFRPEHAKFNDKLCPAPVTPQYLIKEKGVQSVHQHDFMYSPRMHRLIPGFLFTVSIGLWAGVKLFLNQFRPKESPAISNAFTLADQNSTLQIENQNIEDREDGLQLGFTVDEMAVRVEGMLRSIGLTGNFAPLVYVVAHGSSSANNPHHGAHDCGACSGRPGSVNARVFAFMANHAVVREKLEQKGILIPGTTLFVGGLHDTAADQIQFYGEQDMSTLHAAAHSKHKVSFENALDQNAKERSRRFASIETKGSLKKVRKAIKARSVSLFEPRPELGHGTNSLCIVGSRKLTQKLFLDRRAFLNSYDYRTDPEGKILAGVMRPLGPVCGGINLEYYFSRVDNHKLGAGTKLPHNVIGLIGVANSCDGDLRPGLPLQMIEVHDPVRLLVIVEHYPGVVLSTIQADPSMYEWFINDWVHLMVMHPETGGFFRFSNGEFTEYLPLTREIKAAGDTNTLFENSIKMKTNYIADATVENLPVLTLS